MVESDFLFFKPIKKYLQKIGVQKKWLHLIILYSRENDWGVRFIFIFYWAGSFRAISLQYCSSGLGGSKRSQWWFYILQVLLIWVCVVNNGHNPVSVGKPQGEGCSAQALFESNGTFLCLSSM